MLRDYTNKNRTKCLETALTAVNKSNFFISCLHLASTNTVHYRCMGELLLSLFQKSTEEYGNVRSKTVAYVSGNTRKIER